MTTQKINKLIESNSDMVCARTVKYKGEAINGSMIINHYYKTYTGGSFRTVKWYGNIWHIYNYGSSNTWNERAAKIEEILKPFGKVEIKWDSVVFTSNDK